MKPLVLTLLLMISLTSCSKTDSSKRKSYDEVLEETENGKNKYWEEKLFSEGNDNYEKGIQAFNNNHYQSAKQSFELIPKSHLKYKDAQIKIELCNLEIDKLYGKYKKSDKELQKFKIKLKRKYENLCKNTYYMHEILDKLHSDEFKMVKESYEEAPDGSNQIAKYFEKIEDGITVRIMLQHSYSSSHYYRVSVY